MIKLELKIIKDYPEYTICGFNRKRVILVEFPNCISLTTGKSFKWMPTYEQLRNIAKELREIEDESWDKV